MNEHCVTCSDEGVEMRVVEVRDGLAVCEDGSEVMADLVGTITPGDIVLVHAGVALVRLDEVHGRRLDGARQGAEVPALPVPERET